MFQWWWLIAHQQGHVFGAVDRVDFGPAHFTAPTMRPHFTARTERPDWTAGTERPDFQPREK